MQIFVMQRKSTVQVISRKSLAKYLKVHFLSPIFNIEVQKLSYQKLPLVSFCLHEYTEYQKSGFYFLSLIKFLGTDI